MERKLNDQEVIRRNKLKVLQEQGKDPFSICKCESNFNSETFKCEYNKYDKETLHENKDIIKINGRIMSIRQTFGVIKDFYGTVQFYINKKNVDQDIFLMFSKLIDLGDIVSIEATPMKTNTGELTLNVKNIVIVSKALRPLPEKFHGLTDEETRARQRYVDLIVNDDSMSTFVLRSKVIKYIREYFDNNGYLEVETPVLQPILGGASARPFVTHHNTLDMNFYLRVATELPLKKLLVGGFDRVYEIGRIFRNEGMDTTHNPEFTSIESYEAYSDLTDIMGRTENLFKFIADKLNVKTLDYKGNIIDFTKPFNKIEMRDFIKQECGVDFKKDITLNDALELAKKHEIVLLKHQKTIGHIINLFFEKYCENKCMHPTFVYSYPLDISPLAKKESNDPNFTQRFELFIVGKEYANAFSELNNPIDQYERFVKQIEEKEMGNDEANEVDYDFLTALEYGMPPAGGLGVGVDRLVMLFSQKTTIRDVLLFPHMRKQNNE